MALGLRAVAALVGWSRVPPTADGKFYHVVANRIAHGDGYTWLWPDGAVTFAAHYPVGYPALMALPYRVFGPVPGAMMLVNALLGALAVWACHGVCRDLVARFASDRQARIASATMGILLAFSPTLVAYTPALMTEGAVASLLAFAARIAITDAEPKRARSWGKGAALSLTLGVAVLLRPQSVLFAPVLGVLAFQGTLVRRVLLASLVSLGCLAVVVPWTARNCDRMERCVFVSANGGWNLLIGTFPEGNGAWVALDGERVPTECREVFKEAAKDKCFGNVGVRRILTAPGSWMKLVPSKLRATLNHTAAASDHLSEAGAIDGGQKRMLAVLEYGAQRLAFLFALFGAYLLSQRKENGTGLPGGKRCLVLVGTVGFLGVSATLGWLAVLGLLALAPHSWKTVGVGWGGFALLSTIVVHAVFFGAGRYALPLILCTAPLSAAGIAWLLDGYASWRRASAEV